MYNIQTSNPFYSCNDGDVFCITTNGQLKNDGKAVMGAGVAKFARDTFIGVDDVLADFLTRYGNHVFILGNYEYCGKKITLVSFPTKNHWRDPSDLNLIKQSAKELIDVMNHFNFNKVFLPAPGCSNGQLNWSNVKEYLTVLDSRVTVYSLDKETFNK